MKAPRFFWLMVCLFCGVVFASCENKKPQNSSIDTPNYGRIQIAADASFEPVIREQLSMYAASNPETRIEARFQTEEACIRDLFRDTAIRMVLVTRGLKPKEEQFFKDSLGYPVRWNLLASDAIAIIIHPKNPDSLFTIEHLKARLLGKLNPEQTLVFDGLSATSSYRFIKDSLLKGLEPDTAVVRAASNSREVIEYVAGHEKAIGLVGVSWIGNPEDTAQQKLRTKVRIAAVQCVQCPDSVFVKPVQEEIQSLRYPLVRGLYYILKENYHGLGSGLVDFLKYERGQLIFRRSYLGPVMDFNVRRVRINETLPKK